MKGWVGLGCLAAFGVGFGQIVPRFDYNGINRPLLVRISVPKQAHGDPEVRLLAPVTAAVLATASVKAGDIDLARLFPELWSTKSPRLTYAQLFVGGKATGPALILQPMTNPKLSRLKSDGKTVEFVPDEDQAYAGIRVWVDQDIVFDTTLGQIRFRMRPDCAPNTVWNLMHLVSGGFYRDVIWHRVVHFSRGYPFVIQGGDPAGTGNGGPGFSYPLEDSSLPHDFGVISIARSTDPNTNGSQIFVCLSREGTARLDHRYASFGEAISGGDTILKIGSVATGAADRPIHPPVIRWAKLVDAAPYGTGGKALKRPADAAY